jgi:hypothetical protein
MPAATERPAAPGEARLREGPSFQSWFFPGRDHGVQPIRALMYAPQMARNAQALVERDAPINYLADDILVKMPRGHEASHPTGYHQDIVNFPFDRPGFITFWIALDEIAPDQGALRFYSGSHHHGPLKPSDPREGGLPEHYADVVAKCPLSDAVRLAPGDATVHSGLVIHGAPENTTERPRWALQLGYFPADTCFNDGRFPPGIWDDVPIETGKPVRHPKFPVVPFG